MTTVSKMAAKRATQARSTLHAYRRLFSTEDGKTVLKDLMRSCFFLTPTQGKDSYETYLNEGSRAVVLRIMNTSKTSEDEIERLSAAITEENTGMYID